MEKNEQKNGRRGRSYDEAFKREAVRLVSEEKYTFRAAAAAVGVNEQSLRAWACQVGPTPGAVPGERHGPRAAGRSGSAAEATPAGRAGA